jgi:5-methylthioadenosine/S-adenosylhomocysteine deaminase
MQADLVAYDTTHPSWRPFNSAARQLVFSETGLGIRHVWVGGRRIVADGQSTLVDENALLGRLNDTMPRVRRDIDALSADADKVESAFQAIQAEAFRRPMLYDRYLARSSKKR